MAKLGKIWTDDPAYSTGTIEPNSQDADIGTVNNPFRDGHFSGTVSAAASVDSSIQYTTDPFIIYPDTVDGADTKSAGLLGGGTAAVGRGGYVQVFGNEAGGADNGDVNIVAGNASGAAINLTGTVLQTGAVTFADSAGLIASNTADAADSKNVSIAGGGAAAITRGGFITLYGNEAGGGNAGNIDISVDGAASVIKLTGPLRYADTAFNISANTTDGADTKAIIVAGGGNTNTTRGGSIGIYGNEHASNPGKILINSGNIANSTIVVRLGVASGVFEVDNASDVAMWTINNSGVLTSGSSGGGSVVFAKATSGIELQSGANGRTGTFTLNGATPVVVGNTSLAAGDMILIERDTVGGTPLTYELTARTNGTGFTVTGSATDTSGMRYWLVRVN